MMPGGPNDIKDLMNSLDNPQAKYEITREDLRRCAGRVIRAVKSAE
ncbi:MAG: hypothetical protein LUE87_11660 [Lachnospiraceae bacterium]|nr:hypothetical protein [Lachnospiraceae bacterium]